MFRARLTRHPIPHDVAAGAAAVAALAPPAEVAPLVAGAAGCSPFLAAGMTRERDWLASVWDVEPEAALDALLAEVAAIEGDPAVPLRRAKRRAGLLVGVAELGGVWPVMAAAAAWTRFADAAVARALAWGMERHARGPVSGDGGLVAVAMGKMGAGELNYSSDVDLVLLFDETRYDLADYAGARAVLLKSARAATARLSDITAEGYVFRTDLRLRPDPGSTPIVLSMEAAERYYEAMGRTWERAAWIKARACAGAVAAGEGFVERLAPFVWRRHLDFAVVEEAFDMRRRIRDHRGLAGAWDVPGHDVKLGAGGIREIEFLAQTQQIIAGGRDPSLRVRGTLEALDRLVAAGRVPAADRDVLAPAYRHLRAVEHRLQMVRDAQTHRIPEDRDGLDRLARFMGAGDTDAFVADLRARMRAVDAVAAPSFAPRLRAPAAVEAIAGAEAVTDRWATYPALRSERARGIFARLRPAILAALGRAARPAEALAAFDAFLRGLPAGVQVFALFEANPALVDLIADICATAPDLARHLSRNAGVLDAVLDGSFLAPLPAAWHPPDARGDFEAGLDGLRRWHREAHFRIGVHLLRGLAGPSEAGEAYAALACGTLDAAWRLAWSETARRHGTVPGLRLAGLGMGSLGAGRLTARSDLDLVVLHDGAAADAASDGRRSLGAGQWAARFTQVLVTALSAPTAEGRLYEVDLRLRPSGRQGPVATSFASWRAYQAAEAWEWEHLALTRARPVAGDPDLRREVEAGRRAILAGGRFDERRVTAALRDMRARLAAAGRAGGGLAVKARPGGLQDVELAAEAHALLARAPARTVAAQLATFGWLDREARAVLAAAHAAMADARQVLRLLTDRDAPDGLGAGGEAFVARATGHADAASLQAALDAHAAAAAATIDAALDRAGAGG